jgi:hypothetical protein
MEGTRNEKIVIVLSAYIIGFSTAFIAFGVNSQYQQVQTQSEFQRAYVQVVAQEDKTQSIARIEKDGEGLFIVTEAGYKRLLSAKQSDQGASLIASIATPGFHAETISESLSFDNAYIYFCEQQTPDAKNCMPYVYSLEDDALHPVKVNGEVYNPSVAVHTAQWTEGGSLIIDGMESGNSNRPWEFTKVETVASETQDIAPEVDEETTEVPLAPTEQPTLQ